MRVGVTGANGYIGSELDRALPPGWSIVSLGRRPGNPAREWRHCDLRETPPPGLLSGLDAVVHLAADTGGGTVAPAQEMAFASGLASLASDRGIPCVFVSSQAASPQAPTDYGRIKASIEASILPAGAVAIRPGQVYGGAERGLFGTLCAMMRRLPFRPRLFPSPRVQPIHVQDLGRAIFAAVAMPGLRGRVLRIAGDPVSFDAFLAAIARNRLRRVRIPLPIPVGLLRLALRVARRITGRGMDPARLDSLLLLPAMDCAADMALLGVQPRALADGMSYSGTPRRRLLREGHALARALLGPSWRARGAVLRRYVRMLAANGHCEALALHPLLLGCPLMLASLDRPQVRQSMQAGNLAWRLESMCRLCEADPGLAAAFLGSAEQGRAAAFLDFVRAGAAEAGARVLHPFARRIGGLA